MPKDVADGHGGMRVCWVSVHLACSVFAEDKDPSTLAGVRRSDRHASGQMDGWFRLSLISINFGRDSCAERALRGAIFCDYEDPRFNA